MTEDHSPFAPIRLDVWMAEHGPLGPAGALLLALEICVAASRLAPSLLRRVAGSISAACVERTTDGWRWRPVSTDDAAGSIGESDVVEQVGALLFHVLTGRPPITHGFASAHARAALVAARADLSPDVADLVSRALAARSSRYRLAAVSHDLRRALGIKSPGVPGQWQLARIVVATTIAVIGFAGWQMATRTEPVDSGGLTSAETSLADVIAEETQGMALVDEHTYALSRHEVLTRVFDARIDSLDPRRDLAAAYEAWIRTLAGDWFSTDQNLSYEAGQIERRFGKGHPYARAAMLHLASALEARGQAGAATRLRETAVAQVSGPLAGFGPLTHSAPDPPTMAGVIAHVDPNRPELEGFRRGDDGSYGAPMTSLQRYFAGRDGWSLRVSASSACRAAVTIGSVPRRVAIAIDRDVNGRARVRIDGVSPALVIVGDKTELAHVVVSGTGSGAVVAKLGAATATGRLDLAGPIAAPPYRLAYGGPSAAGCQAVCLEIPMPNSPNGSIGRPFTR